MTDPLDSLPAPCLCPADAQALADGAAVWPERLGDLLDLCLDEITSSNLVQAPADRRLLAVLLVARLSAEYGGSREYWPKADSISRALRDARIWAEHDGTTDGRNGIKALARRYRLTDTQIWAILRAQRQHRRG